MDTKKILIIAYYWPPSGGSGVQRWLKFVKYLPSFGYRPYVFTPENPSFAIRDESLLKDVPAAAEIIHFPIWEPYDIFIRLSGIFGGKKKSAKPTDLVAGNGKSLFQKIGTWIRGNFFIPDPRRFWVKPSVNFLEDFLKKNGIHTIITTGPPHSMHLIGLRLKQRNPSLRWLADFRDPWTEWGLLDSLMTGSFARRIHRKLESSVLAAADEIITITPFYVKRFEALAKRQVRLLTNGFDESDFKDLAYKKSDKFLIRHVGIVNEKCDPRPFMRAVRSLIAENKEIQPKLIVQFFGEVHGEFKAFVQSSPELESVTQFTGNMPHKQLLARYGESSLLVLILTGYKDGEGFLPGKLFEYLATGIPILAVGPVHGDAAKLLGETQTGEMLDSQDQEGIRLKLLNAFDAWQKNDIPIVRKTNAEKYSRRMITSELIKLL